jgi:hypothetical protein
MIAVGGCGSSSSLSAPTATATVPRTATATLTAQAVVTSTATPAAVRTATATTPSTATETPTTTSAVFVYWDQNEEEDSLIPSGQLVQLVAPWDPNGQMCIFPDSSGRPGQFVTGYNPTLPSQDNLGSLLPYKNPPVGMAVWDRHGGFTGQTIYVPGSYPLPGSDIGGDIPPDNTSTFCTDGKTSDCRSDADCPNGSRCSGTFNNNGTFTGCAFDSKGDLFAADLGQAQGSMSSPDQGRIIEWFPPDYTSFCIIIGPTQGGDGAHHVNGTGGLRNPGFMAVDLNDNLYVPESGAGRVLKFERASLPRGPQDCGPDGLLVPPAPYQVFVTNFGIPAGIARDPTCSTETANCWAVTNIVSGAFGGNAVGWFDDAGQPSDVKGPIPKAGYSPFGIAVSPSGDVFLVDVGLHCDANGCGSVDGGGGIFKVSFSAGHPSATEKIISGLNFPLGVTLCDASKQVCPIPASQATPVTQPTPTTQPTPGG